MRLQRRWPLAGCICMIVAAGACIAQAPPSGRAAALALEQQGRAAEAESAWQAVAKTHPDDADAFAHMGLIEARLEHYPQAIANYRKALALKPGMPGLRLNLGLAYFKDGQMRAAASVFEPLLKATPKDSPDAARLTTLIGLARYGAGDYAAAIPYLKSAIAADPQNQPFRLYLAHSCLWTKQYQCVLDTYRELIELNAESPEAEMLVGEVYDELKNGAAALEHFQAAVKADPRLPNVHFGYGYLLWKALNYDEAVSEFKAELANNPDHPLAMAYLGDALVKLNRPDEARPELERSIKLLPSTAIAHLDLGIVYEGKGQKDDALRELLTAARLTPGDPLIHWRLGRFYQSVGRNAEAKAELEKTRSLQNATNQSLREQMHQVETTPARKPSGVDAK